MNKYDLEMDIEYDTDNFWDRMVSDYEGTNLFGDGNVYSFNITYMLVQKYSLSILVELIKNGCIKKIYNYISK